MKETRTFELERECEKQHSILLTIYYPYNASLGRPGGGRLTACGGDGAAPTPGERRGAGDAGAGGGGHVYGAPQRTGPGGRSDGWVEDENCFLERFFLECFFLNAFSIFGVFFFVGVWFAQKIPLSWRCWSVYGRDM